MTKILIHALRFAAELSAEFLKFDLTWSERPRLDFSKSLIEGVKLLSVLGCDYAVKVNQNRLWSSPKSELFRSCESFSQTSSFLFSDKVGLSSRPSSRIKDIETTSTSIAPRQVKPLTPSAVVMSFCLNLVAARSAALASTAVRNQQG